MSDKNSEKPYKRPRIKRKSNPKDDSFEKTKEEESIALPPENPFEVFDGAPTEASNQEPLEVPVNLPEAQEEFTLFNDPPVNSGLDVSEESTPVPKAPPFEPPSEPPLEDFPPYESNEGPIEIPYDRNTSYFFMFGVKGAGKSVILSGLFYNLLAHRAKLGDDLRDSNNREIEHQDRGTKLVNDFLEHVPDGQWPSSTPTLNSEGQHVPRQMNMRFLPKDDKKPDFNFCTMDMSGEDLMKLRADSDYDKAVLNPGIEAFLGMPHQNLAFICVYPAHSHIENAGRLSSYTQSFLAELDRTGHSDTPLIMIVSKWDLVSDEFDSPADFLEKNAPIIYGKVLRSTRAVMSFTIGSVNESEGVYEYDPSSSNKLFGWMYRTQVGIELDEPISKGRWQNFLNKFKSVGND